MNNKKIFIYGVSIQSVIVILKGGLEIIVFAIMSRLLTKVEFGYYAAITGIVFIVSSITEAGFGSAVIQKKDASAKFVRTAFSLSWITGSIGSLCMFIVTPYIAKILIDESVIIPLRIMSINIFLACTASVGRSLLMKNLEFKKYGQYELCAYFLSSLIGIVMAILNLGLYSIVAISVCNMILINVMLYVNSVKIPQFCINLHEIREIVSFGGWLTMGVVVNNITQQLDRLLLPKWLSVEMLGAYNRPAGFVNTTTGQINGIFDTVLFPMLSKLQNDIGRVQSVLLSAVSVLNAFSAVMFCLFFFNANLIIFVFFGKEWLSLSYVFQIISIYIIFNIDSRLVDSFFRSLGLVKLGFFLRSISAILTFLLIYIGCNWGLYGVATAIVCANILTVSIKMYSLARNTHTRFVLLLYHFIKALKVTMPLILEGMLFCLFYGNSSLIIQSLFAFCMGVTILIEFLVFPKFVGKEYYDSVYSVIHPSIRNFLKKTL